MTALFGITKYMFRSKLSPRPRTGQGSMSPPRTLCDISLNSIFNQRSFARQRFRASLQEYHTILSASRGDSNFLAPFHARASPLPADSSCPAPFRGRTRTIAGENHERKGSNARDGLHLHAVLRAAHRIRFSLVEPHSAIGTPQTRTHRDVAPSHDLRELHASSTRARTRYTRRQGTHSRKHTTLTTPFTRTPRLREHSVPLRCAQRARAPDPRADDFTADTKRRN